MNKTNEINRSRVEAQANVMRDAGLEPPDLIETDHDAVFDSLTTLAKRVFNVSYASIVLETGDYLWARTHSGSPVQPLLKTDSFSQWVIRDERPLVVPDSLKDERFAFNPFATGKAPPLIRFYAGAPIWLGGSIVGTFNMINDRPLDDFGPDKVVILQGFADQAAQLLDLSYAAKMRKSILAELEQKQQQLDLMQSITRTGYFRMRKGDGVEWSKGVYDIFGLPHDTVPLDREGYMAMVVEADRARLGREIEAAIQKGGDFTHRYQIHAANDGCLRQIVVRGRIESAPDGEPEAAFAIVQDVSDNHQRERALFESRKRLEMIETATGVGFWYQKIDSKYLEWSLGVYAILEKDPATFTPTPEGVMALIHTDEDRVRVAREIAQAIETRSAYDITFRFQRPSDQSIRHIRNIGNVELSPDGQVIALFGIALDTTDIHNVAEGLRRAKLAAEALNQAKSDFIANISHDIRTPLTTITGYAELLMMHEGVTGEAQGHAGQIARASQMLSGLVNDILDAARLDQKQMLLTPGPVDLRAQMDDLMAQARLLIADKPVALTSSYGGRLGGDESVMVQTDGLRLRQVLQNLMANACKFTQVGEISLQAALEANDGETRLHVILSDTGPGIDEALQPHVFERFIHSDNTLNRAAGGSGLGLSISREIVRLMGGEIGYDSVPGAGTRFYINLPMSLVADEAMASPMDVGGAADEVEASDALRVLIVDDHKANRELLRLRLNQLGAEVEEAQNGDQAVNLAAVRAYDVILMDIQMPVMDGLAATRAIRNMPGPNQTTPIIALSAMSDARMSEYNAMESAEGYGFDGTLSKPVDTQGLWKVLKDLV